MARARQLPGATPGARHAARGRRLERRSRSPRAVTRCGAAGRCGFRRRRAPSRAICRRRWGSPSASRARVASVSPAACRTTRSSSAPSVTRAPTTPPRSRRSTPRATPSGSGCRCHCCSSARTTTPASASRLPRAGSPRPSRTSPTFATSWRTASSTRSGMPSGPPSTMCGPRGSPCSSICARCGSGATPAATPNRAIARWPRSPPSRHAIPLSATRIAWSRPARPPRTSCASWCARPVPACSPWRKRRRPARACRPPRRSWRRLPLTTPTGCVSARRPRSPRPRSDVPRSAAPCPRTRRCRPRGPWPAR